jgi:membrane-associated phospholipid phosphatase
MGLVVSELGGWVTHLIESDKFAAFPSLHSAYATTFAYFAIKLKTPLAFLSVPLALGILVSAMYLGQHYLLDLVSGAVISFAYCHIAGRRIQSTRKDLSV